MFEGGFLGLDNIGVFDRSAPLPSGGHLEQADGTAWMAMYCLNMLAIALELAAENPAYEDVASKFFEHFVAIVDADERRCGDGLALWDEEDGFYYDVLHMPGDVRQLQGALDGRAHPALRGGRRWSRRSSTGCPASAGGCSGSSTTARSSAATSPPTVGPGGGVRRLLSIVRRPQLLRVLRLHARREEFLSPYGIRALSRWHREHPYVLSVDGTEHRVDYEPAESSTGLFGGNSNWRGPIWFPVNYLLIESLQKFHHFYGDDLKVECPTGSGRLLNLWEVAAELSRRLTRLFLRGRDGRRPIYGGTERFQHDPHWRDLHPVLRVLPRRRRARASAPATRPAGRPWWPSSSSRAGSDHRREVSPGWTRSGPRVRWHRRSEDGAVAID